MKCEKCQSRLTVLQQKAINEYNFYCEKFYIPKNKFFVCLLEKTRLYFDLCNYVSLLNEDIEQMYSIFNNFSYWNCVTITSTSRFMNDAVKIKVMNVILKLLKANMSKYKSIIKFNIVNVPLTNTKTLALLYDILSHNKSLIEINIQHCTFTFSDDNNTGNAGNAGNDDNVIKQSGDDHFCEHFLKKHKKHLTLGGNNNNNNINVANSSSIFKMNNTTMNEGFYIKRKQLTTYNTTEHSNKTNININTTTTTHHQYHYTIKSIFQGIYTHPTIQHIYFANNNIPDTYCEGLVHMLTNQNNKLKIKNWSHTLHTPYTLTSLPLKYNLNTLSLIDLSHNKLSSVFAKELSVLIESDIYLRKIDLSYNNFEYKECSLLCKALKYNRFILNMNLNCNPGLEQKVYIKIVLNLGKNIKYLKYCWEQGEFNESQFKNLILKYVDRKMFQIEAQKEEEYTFGKGEKWEEEDIKGGSGNNDNDNEEYMQTAMFGMNNNINEGNNYEYKDEYGKDKDVERVGRYEDAMRKIKELEEENMRLKMKIKRKNVRMKSVGMF